MIYLALKTAAAMREAAAPLIAADLTDVFAAAALLGCLYLMIATIAVLRHPTLRTAPAAPAPPVTILKPLYGAEPLLFDRLRSTCRQNYDGPTQIVFGCHDASDPAVKVARNLKATDPESDIAIVVDSRTYGANRKISNLINMDSAARYDVLVMADSDIEVTPDYLTRVVAPLGRPNVGAVTCIYHGHAEGPLAAQLSAQAINEHFLPNVILATRFNMARPCFGSTIAIRRPTLERIGGFRAFVDRLADDYAIGEAVRELGLEVEISGFTVGHVCTEKTLREYFTHQLRLARTIRNIDPYGHAGSFICNPVPLALVSMLHGTLGSAALLAFALCCRFALCAATAWRLQTPKPRPFLTPLNDTLLFGVYLCSFFGSSVMWRGHRYSVASNGEFSHDRR